jgi:hypothetical protein
MGNLNPSGMDRAPRMRQGRNRDPTRNKFFQYGHNNLQKPIKS